MRRSEALLALALAGIALVAAVIYFVKRRRVPAAVQVRLLPLLRDAMRHRTRFHVFDR